MGMFRIWQPYEDAYMLCWNGIVATQTMNKLSVEAGLPVAWKLGLLFGDYYIDEKNREHWPLAAHLKSLALASEGILPILPKSPAKWFRILDPVTANRRLVRLEDEIGEKVIRDLWFKHGFRLEFPPGADNTPPRTVTTPGTGSGVS